MRTDTYTPRVAADIGVSLSVFEERMQMLKDITPSAGAEAEKRVVRAWNEHVQSCHPNLQDMFTMNEPTDNFWQKHLYKELKVEALRVGKEKVA